MAMAVSVSVTVSMGEERKGVLRVTLRVILLSRETRCAEKSMCPLQLVGHPSIHPCIHVSRIFTRS